MEQSVTVVPTSAPVGAEIRGVDLSKEISAAAFAQIEKALHTYGVVYFRKQQLSPEQQMRFSLRFGELETPVLEQYTVPGFPNMLILSNVQRDGVNVGLSDGGHFWHSDSTYRPAPARCSLLYAVEVPFEGEEPLGDTLFVRTDLAYERLPDRLLDRVRDLKAVHNFSQAYTKQYDKAPEEGGGTRDKLTDEQRKKTPDAIHPVIRTHPVSGRKCLYVNEGLTVRFVGLEPDASEELLHELCESCTPSDGIYRHRWQVGDLLIWDNCMTQHRATGGFEWPRHRRYMHRTTVKGSVPF